MVRRFIILVLLLLALADVLGQIDTGTRFSGQGLLTIAYVIACWGLLLGTGKISKTALKAVWPCIALVVWALTTMLWYTPSISGMQNVLCLAALIGLVLLAAGQEESAAVQKAIAGFLPCAIWCGAAAYAYTLCTGGFGATDFIGARSFGITGLFGVAWYTSKWRFGKRGALLVMLALLVEIGASLSRLALVTGLVILTLGRVSATVKGWVWGLLSLGLAIGGFWWMFTHFEPLREHFLSGDMRLRLGDTAINVSGRAQIWRVTYESFLESPWVGQGAGSSAHLLENRFRTIGHPHNDYLRVLHDYGIVGLGLWILAWGKILWRLWWQAKLSERWRRPDAPLQFAAFLTAFAMCLVMVTDNPMTYIFAMGPLGVLIGAAVGAAAAHSTASQAYEVSVAPAAWPVAVSR
jgi:O-antigen ligase